MAEEAKNHEINRKKAEKDASAPTEVKAEETKAAESKVKAYLEKYGIPIACGLTGIAIVAIIYSILNKKAQSAEETRVY